VKANLIKTFPSKEFDPLLFKTERDFEKLNRSSSPLMTNSQPNLKQNGKISNKFMSF